MVWFVCKMHLRYMCTFASENLTVKGLINSPIADLLILSTCTVKSAKEGMLRSNTGFIDPLSSSMLYADWLNFIIVPA